MTRKLHLNMEIAGIEKKILYQWGKVLIISASVIAIISTEPIKLKTFLLANTDMATALMCIPTSVRLI